MKSIISRIKHFVTVYAQADQVKNQYMIIDRIYL